VSSASLLQEFQSDPGVNISSNNNVPDPPPFDGQIGGDILKAFYDANTDAITELISPGLVNFANGEIWLGGYIM
jgi:hypothetical protein